VTCTLNTASVILAAGASTSVTVRDSIASAALGSSVTVGLHAAAHALPSASDTGYIVVNVPAPPAAAPVVTLSNGPRAGRSPPSRIAGTRRRSSSATPAARPGRSTSPPPASARRGTARAARTPLCWA
jgi:hypothetical protein